MLASTQEIITKKTFDIEKFNRLKKDNSYEQILEDGTVVSQMVSIYNNQIIGYDEDIYPPNSVYKYVSFFHSNGNLSISRTVFYSSNIGVSTTYKPNGEVIEVKDYDAPYAFTIKDLAEKMRKEYDLDIYDVKSRFSMIRFDDIPEMRIPYYLIGFFHKGKSNYSYREMLIDGNTGKELYVLDRHARGWEGEDIYDAYLTKRDLMEKNSQE